MNVAELIYRLLTSGVSADTEVCVTYTDQYSWVDQTSEVAEVRVVDTHYEKRVELRGDS